MRLTELRVENWRNIRELQLVPSAEVNLLVGANGAGKTSILEAVYVLSHARSFRTRQSEVLVRQGQLRATVYARVERLDRGVQLGMMQMEGRWSARLDAHPAANIAAAISRCAVVCFEPGSHALIAGASDERRRFIDWGVFHVEPDFTAVARRFRRALRQRNALLRHDATSSALDGWDEEFVVAARPLIDARQRYADRFIPAVKRRLATLVPELGDPVLKMYRGWSSEDDLDMALAASRMADAQRSHTTRGPHRADWSMGFALAPRREQLSRGQEKLCAIACMLAQAEIFNEDHGEWPIVVLDDLPSELDLEHQRAVIASLLNRGIQVFMSSTEIPQALAAFGSVFQAFHVEQGRLANLL